MYNSRKQFLINPEFQFRFSLLFTLAIFVFSLPVPAFIITIFEIIGQQSQGPGEPKLIAILDQSKWQLLPYFLVLEIVLLAMAFAIAMFHSHRIAGPIYKLMKAMVSLRQGVQPQKIFFRKKDNFKELAEEFNLMSETILKWRRRDYEYINSVIPKLEQVESQLEGENKAIISEALNALRDLSKGSN